MTDTERIAFLERTESVVGPAIDKRGELTGWVATCPTLLVSAGGKTWREAVDALRKEMKG